MPTKKMPLREVRGLLHEHIEKLMEENEKLKEENDKLKPENKLLLSELKKYDPWEDTTDIVSEFDKLKGENKKKVRELAELATVYSKFKERMHSSKFFDDHYLDAVCDFLDGEGIDPDDE
jgi:hypothetical protein